MALFPGYQKVREVKFMAKLFERARISDQHRFNLRFDPSGGPPLIPIDTEVCHQNSDICLGIEGTQGVELSPRGVELIDHFREGLIQNGIPFRCLPLSTQDLAMLMGNVNVEKITEGVLSYLRQNNLGGNDPTIAEQIKVRVRQDIMNRDVPMFTRVGHQVFYGLPGDLVIGSQIL